MQKRCLQNFISEKTTTKSNSQLKKIPLQQIGQKAATQTLIKINFYNTFADI